MDATSSQNSQQNGNSGDRLAAAPPHREEVPTVSAVLLLAEISPHLSAAAERTFGRMTPEFILIAKSFSLAMENGGRTEIDFIRAADVSYNPRPARVGIEAMKASDSASPLFSAAAILASANELALRSSEISEDDSAQDIFQRARTLALLSLSPAQELMKLFERAPETSGAALAFLVNFLDRIRHLHQADVPRIQSVLPKVLDDLEIALQLSAASFPKLRPFFLHWMERVAPRLERL